jgi:hypothetical protein
MEVKLWFAALLLTLPLQAQNIAPLTEPPHHAKQELVTRFNEILSHPQDTEKTAWEWYTFTDDSGWRVGGYNWAVVKWNEGYHATALDYFKWLSNHCEGAPEVCRRAKLVSKGK